MDEKMSTEELKTAIIALIRELRQIESEMYDYPPGPRTDYFIMDLWDRLDRLLEILDKRAPKGGSRWNPH